MSTKYQKPLKPVLIIALFAVFLVALSLVFIIGKERNSAVFQEKEKQADNRIVLLDSVSFKQEHPNKTAKENIKKVSADYRAYLGRNSRNSALRTKLKQKLAPASLTDKQDIIQIAGLTWNTQQDQMPKIPVDFRCNEELEEGEQCDFIVQFIGPIQATWRQKLLDTGAKIKSYIPHNAYKVTLDTAALDRVTNIPEVQFCMVWHPYFKLAETYRSGKYRSENQSLEISLILNKDVADNELRDWLQSEQITLAPLTPLATPIPEGMITGAIDSNELAKVLPRLAAHEQIRFIGPFLRVTTNMKISRGVCLGGDRERTPIYDYGLRGEGQIVMVGDTGCDVDHDAFRDSNYNNSSSPPHGIDFGVNNSHRKIICSKRSLGDNDGHGTEDAGIVAGKDLDDPKYWGVAYNAKLFISWMSVSSSYLDAGRNADAWITTNSWGDSTPPADPSYNYRSEDIDEYMWDHKNFLIIFSSGNSGDSINYSAAAKSEITVGACGTTENTSGLSGNQHMWTTSSSGPTQDGRYAVTVVAPGRRVYGPNTDDSIADSNNTNRAYRGGTSQATPAVAASAALIRQYFTEGWYPTGSKNAGNALTPSAALLRAMIIGSATDMVGGNNVGGNAPNRHQGWGRVNVENVLHFSNDDMELKVVDQSTGLSTSGEDTDTFTVPSGISEVRFILVWTDYPAAIDANPALVNNLNLEVTAPDASVYKGNVFSSGYSVTGGSHDALETEEMVKLQNPASGTYTVKVIAQNVPQSTQDYALVMLGVGNRAPHAVIVGPERINSGDTVSYSGTDSYDADGDTLTYQWQLDGSNVSTSSSYSNTYNTAGYHTLGLTVTDTASNTSITTEKEIYVGQPAIWRAELQYGCGVWREITVKDFTARTLIDGANIKSSASTIRLVLKGNPHDTYRIKGMSLVTRDGSTLDGVDGTWTQVTFGGTAWNSEVTVPASGIESNDISFSVAPGTDVWLTYYMVDEGYGVESIADGYAQSDYLWCDGWTGSDFTSDIDWSDNGLDGSKKFLGPVARIISVPNPPSTAPTTLAGVGSASQIDLTWNDNSTQEDGFVLERSDDNVSFSELATLVEDTTAYSDTTVSTGSTYYYRIKAFNEDGETSYANSGAVTAQAKAQPSEYPSSFTAGTPGENYIPLTWTDAGGAVTPDGYLIKINTTGTFTNPSDGTPESNDTNLGDNVGAMNISQSVQGYTFTGLTASTTYYFEIYPYSNGGSFIDYKSNATVPSDNATTTAPDTTAPQLSSWDLNLATGKLTLNFNEAVDASTLDPTAITVQNLQTSSTTDTLTGGTTASSNGAQIIVDLSAANILSLKQNLNLATAQSDSWLRCTTSLINDLASTPNDNQAIADGAAVQVNSYTGDSTAPAAASDLTPTPGDEQLQLSWSNPGTSDFYRVIVLRKSGTAVTGTPSDGTAYTVSQTIGDGTVAYVGNGTGFTDTGLTNGTTYHYKLCAYDYAANYSSAITTNFAPSAVVNLLTDSECSGNMLQCPDPASGNNEQFSSFSSSYLDKWYTGNTTWGMSGGEITRTGPFACAFVQIINSPAEGECQLSYDLSATD